jgi:hypothetical protein
MLSDLEAEVTKIKKDARARGVQAERVQELIEEKIKQAEDGEKARPKRGALDLRDDDGDEMEVDSGIAENRTRTGRVSKRLGLGRAG